MARGAGLSRRSALSGLLSLGSCGLRLAAPDARTADIGCELAPHSWGRGYASEVARSLLHVGFDTLRLHRIAAWCIADNQRAVRVVQRLGMQLEGRMRENDYFKERWWDTLLFALLEHEWHTASQTRYEQEET